MQFIGELVAEMDDPDSVDSKLKSLGRFHDDLGVLKQYLEAIGPLFVQAIRPVLMTQGSFCASQNENCRLLRPLFCLKDKK